jgi:hypothetical protein
VGWVPNTVNIGFRQKRLAPEHLSLWEVIKICTETGTYMSRA